MTKICKEMSSQEANGSAGGVDNSNGLPIAKSLATNRVKKSSASHHKMETTVSSDEMQSLLAKLKELVPNIPRNKKLSKLEIIQYVIDYIFDLQLALDTHPTHPQPLCQSANNSTASSSNSLTSLRQPLAIKWSS
ncbi:unnamed protein product [Medioppia subpectinata]|uniref:BHLH domain-containing protein n=1 Tax=Medioppia subpectinata TaxID=1979941 RepID=A0A7R9KD92_9ACAR|nr:unnamed protein product [Medioppia subpectinata]CAG2100959.1 unnamed protein product [Medioppia subpectinata]